MKQFCNFNNIIVKKLKTLIAINNNFKKILINENDFNNNFNLKNENINKVILLIKNKNKKIKKSYFYLNFINNINNIIKMNCNKHYYYF